MKATGIVRRVDELGRIVIPKEIRKTLKIKEGAPLEIYIDREELLFKKYSPIGKAYEIAENVANSLAEISEKSIIVTDCEEVIATSHQLRDLKEEKLTKEGYKIIVDKKSFAVNKTNESKLIKITTGNEEKFNAQIIVPIISEEGDGLGLIVLFDTNNNSPLDSSKISLLKLSAKILANEV